MLHKMLEEDDYQDDDIIIESAGVKPLEEEKSYFRHGFLKNNTCVELLIGIVIFFIVGEIVLLIFWGNRIYNTIGFVEGVLISVGMIIHMTISLEQAVSFNEAGAFKHVRKTAAIRLFIVIIVLILIGVFDIGSIVAVLIGTFALKVAAYIQPITHKVLAKWHM